MTETIIYFTVTELLSALPALAVTLKDPELCERANRRYDECVRNAGSKTCGHELLSLSYACQTVSESKSAAPPPVPSPSPWELDPYLVGLRLLESGKYREAIAELTKTAERPSADGFVYMTRAAAYKTLGEREKMAADCRKAVEIGLPDDSLPCWRFREVRSKPGSHR
jgi:hypothetical protein